MQKQNNFLFSSLFKFLNKKFITLIFILIIFYLILNQIYKLNFLSLNLNSNLSSKQKLLRIAQVSLLVESTPPKNYGGAERITSYLTEELVRRGHKVTLFATNDSVTLAKLVAKWPTFGANNVPLERYEWLFAQLRKNIKNFDIIHFQIPVFYEQIQTLHREGYPVLLTTHSLMIWSQSLGNEQKEIPLVSISRDQQSHSVGKPNFIANVYHGIPINLYKFIERPNIERPYLAFLGRISESKLPDWAIKIAIKAGYNLKMAARFDKGDKYWNDTIKPLIEANKNTVEFIGEINDKQKNEFLGNAVAFLFPINWAEPFGMVMIEAMACGTPVIARRTGSVPEVIEDGISGILFDTIEQGIEAVNIAKDMDRSIVRKAFENRFTLSTMTDNYLKVYNKIISMKNKIN